jgi:hypothetical protein
LVRRLNGTKSSAPPIPAYATDRNGLETPTWLNAAPAVPASRAASANRCHPSDLEVPACRLAHGPGGLTTAHNARRYGCQEQKLKGTHCIARKVPPALRKGHYEPMNGALRKPERHQFLAERSAGAMGRAKPWLFRPDRRRGSSGEFEPTCHSPQLAVPLFVAGRRE